MQTFNINGTTLAGDERGSGDILILVHGAVGDYRSWEDIIATLAEKYRVITYSRRWHYPNSTDQNGYSYTPDIHAADLVELVRHLGGGPVRMLGHSYGAAICAAVAAERPELVRSMVLAEPSLFGMVVTNPIGAIAMAQAAASAMYVVPLLKKNQPQRALQEFLHSVIGKEDYARLSARTLEVMSENIHTLEPMLNGLSAALSFTSKQARCIAAPTLVVEGEFTTTLFRTTMKALANTIEQSERVTIPGVGHGMHFEAPAAFCRVALEFLGRH